MAKNQLYRFSSSNSYGGGGAAEANLSGGGSGSGSMYTSRSLAPESFTSADLPSFLGSSKYLGYSSDPFSSSRLFSREDGYLAAAAANRIPGGVAVGSSPVTSRWSGPPGVEPSSSADDLLYNPGYKRPTSEALYHQNVMGAHNTIGQTEAWFSTNPLAKRPRFESASNLPIYPQRPGEKDCSYYMLTRTCKFGDSCKFDHPIWVPEGGIPDWKEVPMITDGDYLPERPGDPDCPYFLKTQRCKFGGRCKFNHPKDKMPPLGSLESVDVAILPERPSEPPCAFYMKSGKCKYGASCKFHHPKDLQITLIQQENNNIEDPRSDDNETRNDLKTVTPSILHNSKGLPVRQGEVDCPFYLKTGSCKYGPSCRYNHPERNAINPPAVIIGSTLVASPVRHLNAGIVNPAASVLQSFDLRLTHQPLQLGLATKIYPQRPGETECDFYMKTGHCKFGQICKFHHPIDRSAPTGLAKEAQLQSVKLTLAGLPRREGAVHCPYYMKTGTCKYGATCKFDHPPPAEVMALAIGSSGGQGKEDQNVAESSEEHQ